MVIENTMINSAGLVLIYEHKILLLHPTNAKWVGTYSIPKGEFKDDEQLLSCALRETKEEIGISINLDKERVEHSGIIMYSNLPDKIVYKQVHYFVIYLQNPIELDKTKLQLEEVDWIGFCDLEEAKKRIFWRLKEVLKYLK